MSGVGASVFVELFTTRKVQNFTDPVHNQENDPKAPCLTPDILF